VYHSLNDDSYLELTRRLYDKVQMPDCFLRADGEPEEDKYKELHKKLYSLDGITNEELIDGLMPWFEENQDKLDDLRDKMIGNHDDLFDGRMDRASDDLSDIVEELAQEVGDYLERGKKNKEEKEKPEEKNEAGEAGDKDKDGELKQGRQG